MTETKGIENAEMIIAAEEFVTDVQFRVHALLNDSGITRAKLASRLNVSEARVSQMFSAGAQNLTLRTLGKTFYALGEECYVTCQRLDEILGAPDRDMEVDDDSHTAIVTRAYSGMVVRMPEWRSKKIAYNASSGGKIEQQSASTFDSDGAIEAVA